MPGKPTDFENYPIEGEQVDLSDPVPPQRVVAPYVPIPSASSRRPPARFGRRSLIGIFVGIPVAGVLGAAVLRAGTSQGFLGGGHFGVSSSDESGEYIDVGAEQYSLQPPDGWTLVETSGEERILTKANNRLLALALTDAGSPDVTVQLLELAEQYRGRFKGAFGDAVDTSWSSARRATLTAAGTFGGEAAGSAPTSGSTTRTKASLVIQVLTARKGSRIAAEAQSMADELSAGF